MRQAEVLATIPVALAELRDAGREPAYIDEIGRQVTQHDEPYLQRRNTVRRALGWVGINIPEMPSGRLRPAPGKMYSALARLEIQGVISGEFEAPRDDGKPSRRMYQLVEVATEHEV